jgi:hypothetical protein
VDYYAVGKQAGYQAAEVLRSADLGGMAIRDVLDLVLKPFTVNLRVLKGLRDPWTVPPELLGTFDVVVDE